MRPILAIILALLTCACDAAPPGPFTPPKLPGTIQTEKGPVQIGVVTAGLRSPWSLAFLPNGRFLVTERGGTLRVVEADGRIGQPIKGVPQVHANGQGGLLDVILDPSFAANQTIYLSYAGKDRNGARTTVMRAVLRDQKLEDTKVIFRQQPSIDNGLHFGSRMVFDRDGNLYITMGERYELKERAQDTSTTLGKVVRIKPDGSIPADNPLKGKGRALPEVFTYGHRNPQGAVLHPETGAIWIHEHGPMGGDEINVLRAGANYGWPVITYGLDYSGDTIGEGSARAGMEQPLYQWTPSIAPSGMAFLTSEQAGPWRGNLFVGSLKFTMLVRLELKDGLVVHEERLLQGLGDRVRDVRQGPDGLLYVLTESQGRILRFTAPE
ncbi:oxidoreductase [Ahniella affigens]|uniref:Oxidoreductase n=1 Tax=Ahniella affigens TaxID=2021234 RepID=A0A2P1PP79_9GAMM|nr:PQQ-dependent sugar dehydrogenase [Ahniella affigens]AVP96642.1 oxidoreductase [Ahniella affigens]